jgi:hypothetical protein
MPIVLGVPHIANDLRYLVLPLPRRQVVLSLVACALLVALKAAALVTGASLLAGMSLLRGEMVVVAMWLLGMLALDRPERRAHVIARHRVATPTTTAAASAPTTTTATATTAAAPGSSVRYGAWLLAGTAAVAIVALPIQFAIAAAFLHNVVAIVAWLVVKRPARRDALAVLGAIAGALAILAVAGPAVAAWTGGATSPWLTVDKAAHVMFGGLPLATARACMIGFVFLQAVHYAVWLDWIPRGTPRLPTRPWLAVTAGTLAVIAAALVDAAWARTTYLALATFHIYLELVVLTAVVARPLARRRGSGPDSPPRFIEQRLRAGRVRDRHEPHVSAGSSSP